MVALNLFLSDPPAHRRVTLMQPKPGDFFVVRMVNDSYEEVNAAIEAIRGALEHIGRLQDVAVIVTTLPHDIQLLKDDEMERLGWVRKNKETA